MLRCGLVLRLVGTLVGAAVGLELLLPLLLLRRCRLSLEEKFGLAGMLASWRAATVQSGYYWAVTAAKNA